MITRIRNIHEEGTSDDSKLLGILFNEEVGGDYKNVLFYQFKRNNYIFFKTMTDCFNYVYYGSLTMERAYMTEGDFDEYLDITFDGEFSSKLEWK
jgi:hypothetical protein